MNDLRTRRLRMLLCFAAAHVIACSPPPASGGGTDQTPECETTEEICTEAHAFQAYYERMPEQERKDMVAVLNTYSDHCRQAQENCRRSKRRR